MAHNIGKKPNATSYPADNAGPTGTGDPSLGLANHNYNKVNFETDPPVYNDTPAKKKSYAWNRGETGNANS